MTETIAKIAIINNKKIAMIEKIKADIDLLSIYSENIMNVMKKDINNMNIQKFQKKKKKRRKREEKRYKEFI